jgi:hypothetical protein
MPLPHQVLRQDVNRCAPQLCKPIPYKWIKKNNKAFFRKPRTFAVSLQLGKDSTPVILESRIKEVKTEVKKVFTVAGYKPFYQYIHSREWVDIETGEVKKLDADLKKYSWRWTGHFNTYIGQQWKSKKRKAV